MIPVWRSEDNLQDLALYPNIRVCGADLKVIRLLLSMLVFLEASQRHFSLFCKKKVYTIKRHMFQILETFR